MFKQYSADNIDNIMESNDTYMESSIIIRVSKYIQQSFGNDCEENNQPITTDDLQINEYIPLLVQSPTPEPVPKKTMWSKFKQCISSWSDSCKRCANVINKYHGYVTNE